MVCGRISADRVFTSDCLALSSAYATGLGDIPYSPTVRFARAVGIVRTTAPYVWGVYLFPLEYVQ